MGVVAFLAVSCGESAEVDEGTDESTLVTTTEAPTTSEMTDTTLGEDIDGPLLPPDLDRANFSDPTKINNKWYPLTPGTQLVFDGITLEDGEDEIPHRVVFTVTDLTKVIAGVETVVIWDEDYEEGDLVETEIAFFGQDDEGNVWLMGEYPEEYEDGVLDKAPAWIHGIKDSLAGILVPGNPEEGTPSFAQGWAPSVEWTDRGVVFEVGSETCVPVDCYEDVLIIDEFNPDEPGIFQVKYYAPGVGNVEIGFMGNDPSGETLELVEYKVLSEEEMEEARAAALALEANAYEGSDVYQDTEPIRTPG
jgi:hypothetical protein